ncbi:hypothetical protein KFZ58_18585 [Virgibacillus sp. NKC19-16]|uniref:hypothetical protein n=1 Tax=Virgibacillus salidurans TaxID=2831673 RepID=UPI001F225C50|nr:hypothetical protein [Virgibacillus sp. NKC19-16]UJL46326.1 hypothetical protein KFZ58_18585 [Virgibacillus sp. NKC19-16]
MKLGLGTMKGKVLAGTMAVGLVAGGGFALANTDAGEQLRAWYDGQFNTAVEEATGEADDYMQGQMPELYEEYEGLKTDATSDINQTRDSETASSEDAIAVARDSHIGDVEATRQELLDEAEQTFYNAFVAGEAEINRITEEWSGYAANELPGYTEVVGNSAVADVNTALDTAKENAVSDLEEAIRQAQEELQSDLDGRSENLAYNLRQQVDFNISDVRDTVTELLDGLVQEQQTIVANAAQLKEDEAKSALDDVVAGIDE